MKLRALSLFTGVSCLFSLNSFAIQPLSDFIYASKTHAPSNQIANLNVVEKDNRHDALLFGPLLPSISGSFTYTYNQTEGVATIPGERLGNTSGGFSVGENKQIIVIPHNQFDFTTTLRVPVLDIEAIFRYRSAGDSYEAAKAQAEYEKQQVAAQVAILYYQYLNAATVEKFATERFNLLSKLVTIQKSRAQIGANEEFDVEMAQINADEASLQVNQIQSQKDLAKRTLEYLSGLTVSSSKKDNNQIVIPDGNLTVNDDQLDVWLNEVGGLPAVQMSQKNADAAEEDYKASTSAYAPKVSLLGGNRVTNAAGFQQDPVLWNFGINATVNFDLGMIAAQKAQKATTTAAKLKVMQAKEEAKIAISSAYSQISLALDTYTIAYKKELLATKQNAISTEKYANGLGDLITAFVAAERVFETKRGKAEAYANLELARIMLRITAGKDLSNTSEMPSTPRVVVSDKTSLPSGP